ncbi:MAG TPA: phospho-sugar mutase [Streptosporangiaceae bacterium]|nr:phospho-sugar mutase [Streptosporangiaceae bacterium]
MVASEFAPGELLATVSAWIADDPDEADRAELTALLSDNSDDAAAELADRFAGRLEFGTAGLRGAVAAGPNRMNRAIVRATTAALAGWLRDRDPASAQAGVVIGCDARHRSGEFADEAARVLAGAGIRVHLLPPQQPTPLLAFAVRHLKAAAGVMITASHNPPADNGYKLYLSDGAQIVPPADAEIEAAIRQLGPLRQIPVAEPDSPLINRAGDAVAQAYLDAVCAISPAPASAAELRFVYTPLHGVAAGLATRAFRQAGFPAPVMVAAQAEPDPGFPTVAFPNPEEPGALDLAIELGRHTAADLVIANDPDGDRLAVAVPADDARGTWRRLTGDQVGALLGAYLLSRPAETASELVVSTIVSGTLLSRIAATAGAQYARTLTGFKWIMRAADSRPGLQFVFGYEEALGYAVTDVVRDKDGIGAALALLGLAAVARSAGESLIDAYDRLEATYGVHATSQVTVATTSPGEVMARLRAEPLAALAGQAVISIADLTSRTSDLPAADVLTYRLASGRVVIRPSGTEPKIKAYLEVVEPVPDGNVAEARARAAGLMEPLRDAVSALLAG